MYIKKNIFLKRFPKYNIKNQYKTNNLNNSQ